MSRFETFIDCLTLSTWQEKTDGGSHSMVHFLKKAAHDPVRTIPILVCIALTIGFFYWSVVGKVISALMILFMIGLFVWRERKNQQRRTLFSKAEMYSHPPEGNMKKLLFDDYQSPVGGKYIVKEVQESEITVPSTKSVQSVPTIRQEEIVEFSISDFFDLDSDVFQDEVEPKNEFNFLMRKVLHALKDMVFAHAAMFFWVNNEKGEIVLESRATESSNVVSGKRFPVENDVVSQVALSGKPVYLGRIDPSSEKELLVYYESPEYVKSVVAVPVFYGSGKEEVSPVGVIVADSKAEDAFGFETVSILGNFTKLISGLIQSYTKKYDLLLDSELLSSVRRMSDRIKSDPHEATVLQSLMDEANRLLNWDSCTVTMYSDEFQGWTVQRVIQKTDDPTVESGHPVSFDACVVGETIRTNTVKVITNLQEERACRYSPEEPPVNGGSFLCVPISSINRCYGAVALESRNPGNFSGTEVETLFRLVESASALLEVIYMNDIVKDHVIVDRLTGSFTKKNFLKKVEEEVQRAEDFGADLALVSLAVDNVEELKQRYGKEGFDSILHQIAKVVRANIRPYDIIGRQDSHCLGILFVQTPAGDAYVWAEKVRKMIASHVIEVAGRSFSVTVSVGVCGLIDGMRKDDLLDGTAQVLHTAMENGGNLVRVY